MLQHINLQQRANEELCTFQMAKKVKQAGLSCANTFFAYDNNGEKTDGGSFESLGFDDYYPCINFPFAVGLLQVLPAESIECTFVVDCYHIRYKNESFSNKNIVDLVLELWLYTLNEKR